MVRKKTLQSMLALMACWLTAGLAQARDIKFDVYALAGGSTLVDGMNFTSATTLYHTRFAVGLKYNFGVAIPYNKSLSFEAGFDGGPNNFYLLNTQKFPRQGVEYPVDTYNAYISGVYHAPFSVKHFTPYGAIGLEYDKFIPTTSAVATATNVGWAAVSTARINGNDKVGFNVGAGLDRKFTKRVSLRIDLRDHFSGSPGFGLPNSGSPGVVFPATAHAHNMVYTAGIVFHVGKL